MKYSIATVVLLTAVLCSCGSSTGSKTAGGSTPTPSPTPFDGPHLAGTWEVALESDDSPGNTLLGEVNFRQDGATLTASGTQIALIGLHGTDVHNLFIGGMCPGNGVDILSLTLATNSTISLSLQEGGNTFTGDGTLDQESGTITDASGNYTILPSGTTATVIHGTYSEASGACPDSGKFTAWPASSLDGYGLTSDCSMASHTPRPHCIKSLKVTEKQDDHTVLVSGVFEVGWDPYQPDPNTGHDTPFAFSGYHDGNVLVLSGLLDGVTQPLYVYRRGSLLRVYTSDGQDLH